MTFQFVHEIQYSVRQRIIFTKKKKEKTRKERKSEDTLSEYNEPFFYERLCFQSKYEELK